MKETAKDKLHSLLNVIFYVMIVINFIFPISLVTLCVIAMNHLENLHWSIVWAVRVSLALAIVEALAQVMRTVKLFRKKK